MAGQIGMDEPEDGINPAVKKKANGDDPTGGVLPEYSNDNFQIPGAQMPSSDKRNRIGGAFKSQLSAAKSYLANMKARGDQAYQTYADQSRRRLANSIKSVKNDFNSRGLLGSGLQGDAVASATSAANSDLINKRAEINQGLLGNLNQLEGNVYDTGNLLAQKGPGVADAYLAGVGSNIARESADNALAAEMYGQIGQGVGAVGGSALASYMAGNRGYNPVGNAQPIKGYYDFNKNSSGRAYA